MTPPAWVAVLVALGLAAVALEVFVPSGGVLGLLALAALAAGAVMAFVEEGPWFGLAVLAVDVVAVPGVLALAFRFFPETPLGRRVLPPPPGPDDVLPDAARRTAARGLVGRRGVAIDELLPWGRVAIDGASHEAVSECGPIAAGSQVDVVGVQAAALVVMAVRPAESPRPAPPAGGAAARRDLEEALESFDFDALGGTRPAAPSDGPHLDLPGTPNDS